MTKAIKIGGIWVLFPEIPTDLRSFSVKVSKMLDSVEKIGLWVTIFRKNWGVWLM